MHRTLALLGGFAATLLTGCGGGSVQDVPPVPAEKVVVRPGIDVLVTDSIHLVRGRRVGLVTNQTGIDTAGVSDVEVLRGAGVVRGVRRGREIAYSLVDEHVAHIVTDAVSHARESRQ